MGPETIYAGEGNAADEEEFFSRRWHAADDRTFIPARLEHNPHLDIDAYDRSLEHLDPVTKAQIRRGDWKAHAGGQFDPNWWKYYQDFADGVSFGPHEPPLPKVGIPKIVVIDPANSKRKNSKYTAIGVFGDAGRDRVLVMDMIREHLEMKEIVPKVQEICRRHAPIDWVGFEADGFQKGLADEARDGHKYPSIPMVVELQGKRI